MIIEVKKQYEETAKVQQLLKKLPTQKMLPFNSVCFIEVKIPKQDKCIISLEADYAAEVTLPVADQILQRRKLRLEESFHRLREVKTYEEMQYDLGQKIDEKNDQKLSDKEQKELEEKNNVNQKKQKEIALKKEEETKARLIKEKKAKDEMELKEKQQREKEAQFQKEKELGQVTSLADDLLEIEEAFIPAENKVDQEILNDEKKQLILLISEAFYNHNLEDYDRQSQQLAALNTKHQVVTKEEVKNEQLQKELEPIQEEVPCQNDPEEAPKKISKFKQDLLKKKKK